MTNNESAEPLSEKELEELRSGVMKHPALELFANDTTRKKILWGDIKHPTEYDKFIVQQSDNTDVYVKSQFAYLAREFAYIGRHLERWAEEKIDSEIAEWYKRAERPFTYRLIPIHKSCEEVEGILAKRLPNLREDFKIGYKNMLAVAEQCDIDRAKWFGFVPVKPIENFQLAAEEFHKIVYTIHTEALVDMKKLIESQADLAETKRNTSSWKDWIGNFFWTLYEKTLKIVVDAVMERWWPKQ